MTSKFLLLYVFCQLILGKKMLPFAVFLDLVQWLFMRKSVLISRVGEDNSTLGCGRMMRNFDTNNIVAGEKRQLLTHLFCYNVLLYITSKC
jgi:hypothetical protein